MQHNGCYVRVAADGQNEAPTIFKQDMQIANLTQDALSIAAALTSTGIRHDVHNAGKGAKYTKARRPVELIYFETFEHKSEALKREYQIKQLKRSEKEKLILSKKKI